MVKEMLGARLNTIHNLWYFSGLMRGMREALMEGKFAAFREAFYDTQNRQAEVTGLANGEPESHGQLYRNCHT
jgi:queuine tRNA-ribosyltransferase